MNCALRSMILFGCLGEFMKYSELNDAAKAVARKDYQDGWLETHTDIFTDEELDGFCKDTDAFESSNFLGFSK